MCGIALIVSFIIYFAFVGIAIIRGVLTPPEDSDSDSESDEDTEQTGLLNNTSSSHRRIITRHTLQLLIGVLGLTLSAYILAHSAANITTFLHISDISFGVVILSIATTLPEKLISIVSGYRGHTGILIANCAGSNIFLLSLCCGIILVSTRGELDGGNVTIWELVALWVSTLAFTMTVWFGGRVAKAFGGVMVVAYIAFIVLEFTVIH